MCIGKGYRIPREIPKGWACHPIRIGLAVATEVVADYLDDQHLNQPPIIREREVTTNPDQFNSLKRFIGTGDL